MSGHITAAQNPHLLLRQAICLGIAALVLFVIPAVTVYILKRAGWLRENFRGDRIPAIFGLSIVVGAVLQLAIIQVAAHSLFQSGLLALTATRLDRVVVFWLTLTACFGLLGFVDDVWGDRTIKGLKGHLTAAVRDRRITTGSLKAIGGLVTGIYIGCQVYPESALRAAASALLIALGANAMNLLDLRPGRACAVFLLLAAALLVSALARYPVPISALLLGPVAIAALPAWLLDSRAKVMLGDTGSNLLGASLGLAIAVSNTTVLMAAAIVVLITMHAVAERSSITRIIEGNRVLKYLDGLTGVRG